VSHVIYLVLHGETEWNRERRFQGRLDSPLTPTGREQAGRAGQILARLIDDPSAWTLTSSPLGRARETAGVIGDALGIEPGAIELDERLAEFDLGSWSGLTRAAIEARWPRMLDDASRYDWYFRSPDGETLADLTERLRGWLADVGQTGQSKIAVTHGVASRVLRGLYAGLAVEAAIALEISRDVIFRLSAGSIDRISCDRLSCDRL
jgi:broad specificity phosphatase PhoE